MSKSREAEDHLDPAFKTNVEKAQVLAILALVDAVKNLTEEDLELKAEIRQLGLAALNGGAE